MIETKEQYERAMGKRIPLGLGTTIPVDMMDDIKETIEALREVARQVMQRDFLGDQLRCRICGNYSKDKMPQHATGCPMVELGDWITE